ncbi:MAG: SRPBCC domain-containing protein [Phenylobacterium sp.]|nr:MAG: SRPBCC domain-containing protein [Phenylobacterium sp.]
MEHRLGVQASAETIWDILYDLDRWQDWNPLYPKASGTIRIGQPLSLTLAVPGQPPREIAPVVLDWVPNAQLHWKLSLMGGLVKTTRYIEIEQLAGTSCILANGEIFGGFMGPSVAKQMGRAVHRGFQAMNEALKARAEAMQKG